MEPELILLAQQGSESAFATLASGIADRLYGLAFHLLRDPARADDAAQQAMIDIWRRLPTLRDPARFHGWTYRILVRAVYAEARRHRRRGLAWVPSRPLPDTSPDHATVVADRDELDRALTRLSLDHRAVVVLKHFAGLSNREIAEALEIPEGTVRSRLHHSMLALRAAVDADARPAMEGGA